MRSGGVRRRTVAALGAAAAAATSVVLVASPAAAATVPVTLDCDTVVPGGSTFSDLGVTTTLTVTAPAAAPTLAPIVVDVAVADAPRSLPVALTDARVLTTAYSLRVDAPGRPDIGVTAASDPLTPGPVADLAPSVELDVPVPGPASFQPAAPYEPGDQLRVRFVKAVYTLEFDDVGGAPTTATIECLPRTGTPDASTGAYVYDPIQIAQIGLYGEPVANPVGECEAPCSTQQNVFAEVTPGTLSQRAVAASGNPSPSQVEFAAVTTADAPQDVTADMNPIEVTDARGGSYGWSLTATLTDPFTSGTGATIGGGSLVLGATTCSTVPGSAAVTPGPGGALSTLRTVASVTAGTLGPAGSGGGQYECGADLTLTVPPFQRTGTYTATMTLTLA